MIDEPNRRRILQLLDAHRNMTIATLRPDGWPQATTVGYANDGLTLYFLRAFHGGARAPVTDRAEATVISVLDFGKGFGHTDLLSC